MNFLDEVKTYSTDHKLFRELGLKTFKIGCDEKYFVGKVNISDKSNVKIWVEGCPAQFWYFEIYCEETKEVTKFETGSGSLTDYWDFAKAIAEEMVVIK